MEKPKEHKEENDKKKDNFELGETFDTYEELSRKVEVFEKTQYVSLFKADSRSIKAAQNRVGKNKILKPELLYAEIKLCCVYGGKFKSKGTGKRRS